MSNILPKKSWHVYNAENREKVRLDEEQERIKTEQLQQRAQNADREQRLAALRKRAELTPLDTQSNSDTDSAPKHIDLFSPSLGEDPTKLETATASEIRLRKDMMDKHTVFLVKEKPSSPWYENIGRKRALWQAEENNSTFSGSQGPVKNDSDRHSWEKSKLTRNSASEKALSIDELRQKRLQREKLEKAKADAMRFPAHGSEFRRK